jgi:TPP-dependent pyruvate/acetoin dehydrogenase alpha subunit
VHARSVASDEEDPMSEPADRRLEWYRQMVRIRVFEDRVQELFMSGRIEGTTHLCQGQEAVSVGAIGAMQDGDVQTNTYRGHGEALALGMTFETAMAELMGKATGGSKGLGGSMHLIDNEKGNIGANAIVGAGMPIAVGAALAFKLRAEPHVALTFLGDGSTNIGTFHESMNMAATWQAPVVVIVTNNLYGEYSPVRMTTSIDDLARRADAYDMPGVIVDGQDVEAVHAAVAEAVTRARAGDGPSLLEMKTYRYRGHSRSDPAKYRVEGELEAWQQRDPLLILGDRLLAEGRLSEAEQASFASEAEADVVAAITAAEAAPTLTLEEAASHVYAD